MISLLAGLVQGGHLVVSSLGGEVRPAPGFQLLLLLLLGALREELASLVTSISVTRLSEEELRTVRLGAIKTDAANNGKHEAPNLISHSHIVSPIHR